MSKCNIFRAITRDTVKIILESLSRNQVGYRQKIEFHGG